MKYRIIATGGVCRSDYVFVSKTGIVYLDENDSPKGVDRDKLVAVLETTERDVTGSFIGSFEDYS